jgi:hypothetical protein
VKRLETWIPQFETFASSVYPYLKMAYRSIHFCEVIPKIKYILGQTPHLVLEKYVKPEVG